MEDQKVNIITTEAGKQMVFQTNDIVSISAAADDDQIASEQSAIMDVTEFKRAMKKKSGLAVNFDTMSGRATLMQKKPNTTTPNSAKDVA